MLESSVNIESRLTMQLTRQKTRPVACNSINPGTGIGIVKSTGRLFFAGYRRR